ncbi:MAG: adenylate/guanylate cyclase domain-containing protein [Flavobacteriales bacterium]
MKAQTSWADKVIDSLTTTRSEELSSSLVLADSAYKIFEQNSELCKMIEANILCSSYLEGMGKVDVGLQRLLWSLDAFKTTCDSLLLMEIYLNLSSTYLSLGDFEQAVKKCNEALGKWNKYWPVGKEKLGLLNNKGIALASMGEVEEADNIFRKLLAEARQVNEAQISEEALINIGTLFGMEENLDSASFYFYEALRSVEQRQDYESMMDLKRNIGVLERERENYKDALHIFREYGELAKSHDDLQRIENSERNLADVFLKMDEVDSAYQHLLIYNTLHDSIVSIERVKSIAEMQEKYESVKKEKEIDELKVKNLDAALKNEKVKRTRNAMYAGAGLLLITLGSLFMRYRHIRKNRNELLLKNDIIAREKQRSDDLLKNILPNEVAEELKEHGKALAQDFECVTILFSDFKGFTSMSERLSASELVGELDICFQAFDHIVTQYGLEKIKTIGDAYMAVGGLPNRAQHNALNAILAAIDMQEFIGQRKVELTNKGWLAFDMRMGLHSGPVVAGVVGVKKFQYDVWGDSVNTASRMESSGEVGMVNISGATYELIKDEPILEFEYRGKVQAKGKGEMDMYFVKRKKN